MKLFPKPDLDKNYQDIRQDIHIFSKLLCIGSFCVAVISGGEALGLYQDQLKLNELPDTSTTVLAAEVKHEDAHRVLLNSEIAAIICATSGIATLLSSRKQ